MYIQATKGTTSIIWPDPPCSPHGSRAQKDIETPNVQGQLHRTKYGIQGMPRVIEARSTGRPTAIFSQQDNAERAKGGHDDLLDSVRISSADVAKVSTHHNRGPQRCVLRRRPAEEANVYVSQEGRNDELGHRLLEDTWHLTDPPDSTNGLHPPGIIQQPAAAILPPETVDEFHRVQEVAWRPGKIAVQVFQEGPQMDRIAPGNENSSSIYPHPQAFLGGSFFCR
ncbi:hypothetical protein M432DRAFT_87268 [Thermoascus aurantiacus ATCC 26904]